MSELIRNVFVTNDKGACSLEMGCGVNRAEDIAAMNRRKGNLPPAPNPECCGSGDALCETCWSKLPKNSPLRRYQPVPSFATHQVPDDDESDFPGKRTHNQKGTAMLVTSASGETIATNAWDYGLDFSGGIPRLNFKDIASQRLVDNVRGQEFALEKAQGSNADLMDDGKTPSTEAQHRGYWDPRKRYSASDTGQKLIDYMDEVEKENRKRMQLGTERGGYEEDHDILGLPNMDEFIESETRKAVTARLARQQGKL